jgi:hypothetical protein
MLRILTDRRIEYCGRAETHDYQLLLAINDIDILLKGKTRLEELFAEIDARIVREEIRKTQEDSAKITTKIRRVIKKPQLPKIVAKLFTNHLNNQKSN